MTTLRNLDSVDAQIVGILQEDGRTSNRALARQIGVTEAAIRKRMRRLLDSGAIRYGLIIDVSATDMQVFGWAQIEVHPRQLDETFRAIVNMELCSGAACKTGRFNLLAHMYAQDRRAMNTLIDEIGRLPGVRSINFRQVDSYPIHRYEYVINTIETDFMRWNVGLMKQN